MTNYYRIYCYTNQITNQKYVGCTNLKYQSQRSGPKGNKYIKMCSQFGQAIQQYGWSNFVYSVLEDNLTKEQAEDREKYWISELDTIFPNGYNLQSGGKRNCNHNEETRKRISISNRAHSEKKSQKLKQLWNSTNLREMQSERMKSFYSKDENRKKASEIRNGKFWWTDGSVNRFSKECPGLNYYRGMTKTKYNILPTN